MLLRVPFSMALAADALMWSVWSVVAGLVGARWPDRRFEQDGRVTRLRRIEHGRLYDRLRVRRWKRWLPDLGRFGGGRSKRPGRSLDRQTWEDLEIDCRRAELVHWTTFAALPLTVVWSDGPLTAAMVAYAVIANLPCIVAQRHTRLRLTSLRMRMSTSR